MEIEFLGTGGAITIPRPLCHCNVCSEARNKGIPFSRMGPSIFVHGPDLLIDTPEDIYHQINRSTIEDVKGVIYSHWHPDHVMGRRIIESLSADWINHPPQNKKIDVYIPEQVDIDFQTFLGSSDHLNFFESQGFADINRLKDGASLFLNDTKVLPFRLAEDYVYAFLMESDNKKVLIAMDELNNWKPHESVKGVDLAILPVGIFEFHPITGERLLPEDHPVFQEEATFNETLEIVKSLEAKHVILTHIEEPNGLSFSEFRELEMKLKSSGLNVEFAYDTQLVKV
ncbi:phosphoribosyl 1,2-cyclic phosphate phosphodiesterase [Halobacillus dabanensis]|uniref:Phosphoribosyl 1,2-cyclic phosphate phosphodiesterase n=1 Tax=Halobacillus dabanensis TaxID=240302 RepID=A0A1I3Q869_HALDA|nr:MBL fold metallo-hydrolase [Halobacillus dabanensis]SFJ29890.1 phosphoribosyl 1,2-cyclic phosphate phosphodiesterase [Halobacillus dabanensis]